MNDEQTPRGQISVGFVFIFYGALAVVAWLVAGWLGLDDLFFWHNENATSITFDGLLGAGLGIVVVALSQLLDRVATWAQELGREFGKVFGKLRVDQILGLAVASGVGEELFFRGFLQQALSEVAFGGPNARMWALIITSVGFGLLHIGPDVKKFLPWTIMAIVFGFVFGGMYWYTGNLLAPIVAHFTINFFNITAITEKYGGVAEHDE